MGLAWRGAWNHGIFGDGDCCSFCPVQSLGNAPGLYEKAINEFSVKNQMRWRSNMGGLLLEFVLMEGGREGGREGGVGGCVCVVMPHLLLMNSMS